MKKGFNHLTLRVSHLQKSIDFYCDLLEMTLVHRGRTDAYLEWGDAWICLLEKEGHALYPTSLGMDHVAFSVDETTFHLLVEKITKQTKKVIRAPVNRGGGLSFQFLDPDDIILEFYTGNLHQRMKSWK